MGVVLQSLIRCSLELDYLLMHHPRSQVKKLSHFLIRLQYVVERAWEWVRYQQFLHHCLRARWTDRWLVLIGSRRMLTGNLPGRSAERSVLYPSSLNHPLASNTLRRSSSLSSGVISRERA